MLFCISTNTVGSSIGGEDVSVDGINQMKPEYFSLAASTNTHAFTYFR